ncbi:TIGR03084 family metal-binding protein [Williamsia phyllosphaerae]|nr:TIGR03084 family metal-binding protein [Williamsia phyllosphaerae]
MTAVESLVADMVAEGESLDALVADLDDDTWRTLTPAVGWTIAHQIGHLSWTDRVATLSAADPDAFADVLTTGAADPAGFVDTAAELAAADAPGDILATWRTNRAELATALVAVPSGTKLSWFGPPMSAASMATARIMELWAHGLDVADTLGVTVEPTSRIRAVAHIGVRTRDFAYIVNGATPPTAEFRVELTAPDGSLWTWGPDDATDRVSGPAVDFCRLVTQRRAPADLDLSVRGDDAAQWIRIAQCFAGPPGPGRAPRSTEMSTA